MFKFFSFLILFFFRFKFFRFGRFCIVFGVMVLILFFVSSNVFICGDKGKFLRSWMLLLVRLIELCGLVMVRFLMVGILWFFFMGGCVVGKLSLSVDSICFF